MPALTAAQRKQLRARAHALKPIILVGDAGVSDAVIAETDSALEHHELVKVRLPGVAREVRAQMARTLCEALGAELVQAIGRVQVLFRPPSDASRDAAILGAPGKALKPDKTRQR